MVFNRASCISHRSCHMCSRAGERLARRRAATAGPSRRRLCSNCPPYTLAVPVRPQPRRWPRRTDGGAHRAYATETLRVAAGGVARPRPLPGRPRPDGSWQVSSGDAGRGVPISIEETHAIGRSGPGTRYLPFAIHGPYKQFYTGRVSHFRGSNFACGHWVGVATRSHMLAAAQSRRTSGTTGIAS